MLESIWWRELSEKVVYFFEFNLSFIINIMLSPLDNRYAKKLAPLSQYFSEFALQKYRIAIELKYLEALSNESQITQVKKFSTIEKKNCDKIITNFSEKESQRIKKIESKTNHDVKAIEYFLIEKLKKTSLKNCLAFLHFALTSEDVNNLALALMTRDALKVELLPKLKKVYAEIFQRAKKWQKISLLSQTHGQPATPTTLGKEFLVFANRLKRQIKAIENQEILGKLNGATGTFAAHTIAFPQIDWPNFSTKFIRQLGLTPNLITTQIEPHDWIAELVNSLGLANSILIDFSRDCWTYISRDLFNLKKKENEVGSSTMPHKVNPINFENAEGNFGVSNALLKFFAEKLPISRLQRDLTDSTVLRNLGVAFGHAFLGWQNLLVGIEKLEVNHSMLKKELAKNPAVLAEAVQTILRKNGDVTAYEKLKNFTRGEAITLENLREFVSKLKLPATEKKQLLELTPEKYIGIL
jgi:adenylosuccinate lyase